jgi:hypothetical protein
MKSTQIHSDAEHVAQAAEQHRIELEKSGREGPAPTRARRLLRLLERTRQALVWKVRGLVRDHWDVGVFDVLFGCVKAFGIYPALFFAGLGWTIPVMECAPLNTQLWTAAYLFLRGRIRSRLGRRRYGHSLDALDALRDRCLAIHPRDARSIHRFRFVGVEWVVRVRRSCLRHWWAQHRAVCPEPNVILQAELRGMISDQEFLFRANPLRANPYLYEAVLLSKILSASEDRPKLLARLTPEDPLEPEGRDLWEAMGETSEPRRARLLEQGDSLAARLHSHVGGGFSATKLAFRALNLSYRRTIRRKMAALEALEYGLLADLVDGRCVRESQYLARLRRAQLDLEWWIAAAGEFGEKAKTVTCTQRAHRLLDEAIDEARTLGMPVRMARTARWLSTLPVFSSQCDVALPVVRAGR